MRGQRVFVFVSFCVFLMFCLFAVLGPKTGLEGPGRCLKRCLEAVGFVLAEFEPKRSHGDPIRDIFRVNFQDAISRNIIERQHRFLRGNLTP